MSTKITGLDEFRRQLEDLKNKVESVSGERSVLLRELLSPEFLAACSTFSSVEEMFERSGFKVESQEDFAAIPDEPWDEFIRSNTSYFSWQEMLQAAGAAWTKTKLDL